jgi:cysteinyl-tRNA synthetase
MRFKQEHAAEDGSVSGSVLADTKAAFRYFIGKNLLALPSGTSLETFSETVSRVYRKKVELPLTADDEATKQTVESLLLIARLGTTWAAA